MAAEPSSGTAPGDAIGTGAPRMRAVRADARRNREAIVAATVAALRENPDASVSQIAATAGLGRMTLYGHFESRAVLLDAALVDVLERSNQVLDALDLDGDPGEALEQLVRSSWALLEDSRALVAAAQRELTAGRIRDLHEQLEGRVRRLVERGQRQGVFRADVPASWLVAVMHALMNAAAEEIAAARMSLDQAPILLATTLRGAFSLLPGLERGTVTS